MGREMEEEGQERSGHGMRISSTPSHEQGMDVVVLTASSQDDEMGSIGKL
jgi:hypothetical protein